MNNCPTCRRPTTGPYLTAIAALGGPPDKPAERAQVEVLGLDSVGMYVCRRVGSTEWNLCLPEQNLKFPKADGKPKLTIEQTPPQV